MEYFIRLLGGMLIGLLPYAATNTLLTNIGEYYVVFVISILFFIAGFLMTTLILEALDVI